MRIACVGMMGLVAVGFSSGAMAAAATHFSIDVPQPLPWYTATTVNATALDATNTIDTTYNGTAAESSSDPGFSNLGPVTFSNGSAVFNVAFKTAGTQTLTLTDTVNPALTGTATFTVPFGAPNRVLVSAPGNVAAGTPFNFTVVVVDLFNNTVTDYAGTLHFTSSDAAAVLPADSTLTGGTGTFTATFNTKPTETLSATDTENPDVAGTSSPITTPVRLQEFGVE